MQALSSIRQLSLGDHLCCMYMTEEEHQAIVTQFISMGLKQGEKVFYIVDARTAETVLSYLNQENLDVDGYLTLGQLVIAESLDTYVRKGSFDPKSMLSLLGQETEKALDQGFKALRVRGEMSWALRDFAGTDRLMEYEAKLNQFFPKNKAIGLCQYDMRRFSPEVLLDVLATHPIAIVRKECYDNMYYMPPEEFLSSNRAEAELKRRLFNLKERKKAEEDRKRFEKALKESEAQARREADFANAIFDIAGALILVLDTEGRITRFNRTCEEVSGFKASEVQGKKLWDLLIPEREISSVKKVFNQLSCGRFPNRFENDWLTKEGSRVRVAWSNTCLSNHVGEVELVVSIGLDITEESLAEKIRKREFSSLQKYSGTAETVATASSLGVRPMKQEDPESFKGLVLELDKLLEKAMEETIYKTNHKLSHELRGLSERLGNLRAGPRDVVQAYIQVIQEKTKEVPHKKARAYTEEGRFLLVELMGYLAAFYYNLSLGKEEYNSV